VRRKSVFQGLKRLLLSPRPDAGSENIEAMLARALFQPPEGAMAERSRGLIELLKQVAIFERISINVGIRVRQGAAGGRNSNVRCHVGYVR